MREKIRLSVTIIVIIAAIICIWYGASRGEPMMVMMKAIRICMECIGLGR